MKIFFKTALLFIGLVTTALPVMAQEKSQRNCSDGKLWVPEDNSTVDVSGFCKEVTVAGNGNIVTVEQVGQLKVLGDSNTVNYREKTNGNEPEHWFGGNGNKLIYIGKASTTTKPSNKNTTQSSPSPVSVESKPVAEANPTSGKRAPLLVSIPGPRVKITQKILDLLPDGYRMHVSTTNYWTSSDMMRTRMLHLTLTKDGQFEKGHFSIAGSMDGSVGTMSAGDKNGTTGSVLGSTHPGQAQGAQSVYLKKREGLDPTKYGTYYISGDQIEFRYANGKLVKHKFKTDGYKTLVIDGKEYWGHAPDGWERQKTKNVSKYRSLDGAYMIRVSKIKGSVPDGVKWLKDYIARGKKSGLIVSASAIKKFKPGKYRRGVVMSTMTIKAPNSGVKFTQDFFVRYGTNSTVSRLIRVDRYSGGSGNAAVLEFINDVD